LKICAVTGSRADYDRLKPVLQEIRRREHILNVIAMAAHLSPIYGSTVNTVVRDGFHVSGRIRNLYLPSSGKNLSRGVGEGVVELSKHLDRLKPDWVLVLGDRSELLSVASACVCQSIPLAHLCGGEVTEGALDEQVRHMVTKAAHLHAVANRTFAARVLRMGEERWRVRVTGSPGIDALKNVPMLSRDALGRELRLDLRRETALVAFHPETLSDVAPSRQISALLDALSGDPKLQLVITYPNSDPGSENVIRAIHAFGVRRPDSVRVIRNLGSTRFYSLMKYAAFMIGNSSSGIVEAPSFGLWAVNVGNRQAGRVFGPNVLQAGFSVNAIRRAVARVRGSKSPRAASPYGDGRAAGRIVDALEAVTRTRKRDQILRKRFTDGRR
jgi:UDP-hydrolysing UDP-N-acetyl-D-glucosamine 2-epimerase